MQMKGCLVLEDGTTYEGNGFGAESDVYGEICFCTEMTGYQEALTDPSYAGQILTMTYPLVGNYGINDRDNESSQIQTDGFVVREICENPIHPHSKMSVDKFLKEYDVPGISNIDTRSLTLNLRQQGVMKAALVTGDLCNDMDLVRIRLDGAPDIEELDLVERVTCDDITHHPGSGPRIVVLDLGMKYSIRDSLLKRNCELYIVPADTSVDDIRSFSPDGLVISPGPGDPENLPDVTETVRQLLGTMPMFGICLGHQILALARGGETYKLKYGHRGANQPVKDILTNNVFMTTQNHGYAVRENSLPTDEFKVDKINVSDSTVEGMRHRKYRAMSVQFHPEAHPGPHDSEFLFDEFLEMVNHD